MLSQGSYIDKRESMRLLASLSKTNKKSRSIYVRVVFIFQYKLVFPYNQHFALNITVYKRARSAVKANEAATITLSSKLP